MLKLFSETKLVDHHFLAVIMNPELLKTIEDACIVNIKSEGSFDKLRSECIGEVQKEFQFQQLRSQIEDQTIYYIKGKRDRSSGSQTKNEVRAGLRTHLHDALSGVLKSQMDSLVDSMVKSQESYMREIVTQTVVSMSNSSGEELPPQLSTPETGGDLIQTSVGQEEGRQRDEEENIQTQPINENNDNNNNNSNNDSNPNSEVIFTTSSIQSDDNSCVQ